MSAPTEGDCRGRELQALADKHDLDRPGAFDHFRALAERLLRIAPEDAEAARRVDRSSSKPKSNDQETE